MNLFNVLRRARLALGCVLSLVLLSACLSSAGPEAPTITEQPKDRVAFVGQAVKFDFGGSGKPPFSGSATARPSPERRQRLTPRRC